MGLAGQLMDILRPTRLSSRNPYTEYWISPSMHEHMHTQREIETLSWLASTECTSLILRSMRQISRILRSATWQKQTCGIGGCALCHGGHSRVRSTRRPWHHVHQSLIGWSEGCWHKLWRSADDFRIIQSEGGAWGNDVKRNSGHTRIIYQSSINQSINHKILTCPFL